jgi:cyanophycinase-like exopeptidase
MKKSFSGNGRRQNTSKFRVLSAAIGVLAATSFTVVGAAPKAPSTGGSTKLPYSYFVTEDTTSPLTATKTPPTTPSFVLMGGGPDVDPAFQWMIKKAGIAPGTGGRFVIIRATGTEAYNPYIFYSDDSLSKSSTVQEDWVGGASLGLTSVETLVIPSIEAAKDSRVNAIVSKADAVFIAGGDQSDYVKYWKGTPLADTLKDLMGRNVPIGGTSAGLAVLGNFDFAALNGTVTSPQALSNPYNKYMTLDPSPLTPDGSFLNPAALENTILDSHLDARDRMGRLIAFTGRLVKFDGSKYGCPGGILTAGLDIQNQNIARGIGIGVESALLVEFDTQQQAYTAKMETNKTPASSPAAFFIQPTILPGTCASGKPLTMAGVEVRKLTKADPAFNLKSWTGVPVYHRVDISAGQMMTVDAISGKPVTDPY